MGGMPPKAPGEESGPEMGGMPPKAPGEESGPEMGGMHEHGPLIIYLLKYLNKRHSHPYSGHTLGAEADFCCCKLFLGPYDMEIIKYREESPTCSKKWGS